MYSVDVYIPQCGYIQNIVSSSLETRPLKKLEFIFTFLINYSA